MDAAAPQASIAIVSSITQFAPEPPRLDRYRNELAAGLLGIPAIKANTEGLLSLRKLSATAPDPASDVVFLSQPRAVNVVKAFQQWITSDEDVDEEVESEMTLIFFHLAPLLQNVSGAHWEFMFDIIENNLEVSQCYLLRSIKFDRYFFYTPELLIRGRYYACCFSTDFKINCYYPRSRLNHQNASCGLGETTHFYSDAGKRFGGGTVRHVTPVRVIYGANAKYCNRWSGNICTPLCMP
jgi:hypothetical protein